MIIAENMIENRKGLISIFGNPFIIVKPMFSGSEIIFF